MKYINNKMSKIVNISEAASIAIHSIILVAKSEVKLNANQIAETLNFSRNHLSKVMHVLAKNGYLSSERGPKGGFMLNKDPKKISLLEIYEVVEGIVEAFNCVTACAKCPFKTCIFGGLTTKFTEEFTLHLRTTKVADLI
jgi:Rrf2 family protein